jgi:ubiquinone/menaquinone biosynthesis C-methylase UbiE
VKWKLNFSCRVHLCLLVLLSFAPPFALALDEYEREVRRLGDLMDWKPGQTIAEIGAGEGQMSFFASERVGPSGHVYITELEAKKLDHLKAEVRKRALQNITVINADAVGTNLADNCCEYIFMRRVYHHFKDPSRTDAALFRNLKPGGLLAVIDFPPRSGLPSVDGVSNDHHGHGVSKQIVARELTGAGFQITNESNNWPSADDYCIIVCKPAGPP